MEILTIGVNKGLLMKTKIVVVEFRYYMLSSITVPDSHTLSAIMEKEISFFLVPLQLSYPFRIESLYQLCFNFLLFLYYRRSPYYSSKRRLNEPKWGSSCRKYLATRRCVFWCLGLMLQEKLVSLKQCFHIAYYVLFQLPIC